MKNLIGIDPAFRKSGTGVAVINKAARTMHLSMRNMADVIIEVCESSYDKGTVFVVENSNLQNVSFRGLRSGRFGDRSVGKNQAVSQLLCDIAHKKGAAVVEVAPNQKGRVMTAAEIDGWAKRNGVYIALEKGRRKSYNPDIRVAATLAIFGMRIVD